MNRHHEKSRTLWGASFTAPLTLVAMTSLAVVASTACGSSNNSGTAPPPSLATNTAYPAYGQPGYAATAAPGYATAAPPGYATAAPPGYATAAPAGYPATAAPGYPTAYPTAAPTYAAPPATTAAPPATTGGFQFPGLPTSNPPASSGASATPIDPSLAQAAVLPLQALAQTEAPGMTAAGAILAGNFAAGQTLQQSFTLTAGKCYTILGVGAGITELDISIVAQTPIPGMNPVLQQDSGTGNSATLGGQSKGGCWHWQYPFNAPAVWILKASSGSGIAAAQLYSK